MNAIKASSSDLLVVGSVAIDSLHTPSGDAPNVLGGSATHFALAARLFCPVHLVGVVGKDFPPEYRRVLGDHDIDIEHLETHPEKPTFRWEGKYHEDLNKRDTLHLELGCFMDWRPTLPDAFRRMPYVFCANIHPAVQRHALESLVEPQFTMLDTIDHWITTERDELSRALEQVDAVVLNEDEARELTGLLNLVQAARAVGKLGPDHVVVKKGEHGALLLGAHEDGRSGGKIFPIPAYPLEDVVDPTGAGDSFAGGFMGSLAESCAGRRPPTSDDIRRAVAYGTVLASFNVQGLGTERVRRLKREEVEERFQTLCGAVAIPA